MAKLKQEVIWQPQPGPQTRLVTCPVFEVFFGMGVDRLPIRVEDVERNAC